MASSGESPRSTPLATVGEQLRSLLLVLLLALVLRWGVIEPRWIPSESMLPTLQPRDRVLVWKLGHRLGLTPARGSIVVFRPPPRLTAGGYDGDAALIKRVVGLPGDRITVANGQLQRNGSAVPEGFIAEPMAYTLPDVTVADDDLLVLGDNRNASLDSHLWGPLPEERLIGVALWRYWPLGRFGPLPRD
jgi:signal peptidase I